MKKRKLPAGEHSCTLPKTESLKITPSKFMPAELELFEQLLEEHAELLAACKDAPKIAHAFRCWAEGVAHQDDGDLERLVDALGAAIIKAERSGHVAS